MATPSSSGSSSSATQEKPSSNDLDIAEAKLEILQDVVLELKEKEDTTVSEWKAKVNTAKEERDKAVEALQQLERDFAETKKTWSAEKRQHKQRIDDILSERDVEAKQAAEEIQTRKEKEKRLRQKIESMNAELDRMDEAIVSLKQERDDLRENLHRDRHEGKRALDKERQKVIALKEDLATFQQERDDALKLVGELEVSKQTNDEAIEIARASVAAAERREAAMSEKYKTLKTAFSELQADKDQLKKTFESTEEENSRLANELAEAVSNTAVSETENRLTAEVEALNEQIRLLKQVHAAKVRAEKQAAEDKLLEMSERYHKQMQQVRNAAIMGRVDKPKRRGVRKRISSLFRREREE